MSSLNGKLVSLYLSMPPLLEAVAFKESASEGLVGKCKAAVFRELGRVKVE